MDIYFQAILGGITGYSLGRLAEAFYKYCQRRYRSAHTTTPNTSTADAGHVYTPYESETALHLLSYSTPVTPFGHALSDMDRDTKKDESTQQWKLNTSEGKQYSDVTLLFDR